MSIKSKALIHKKPSPKAAQSKTTKSKESEASPLTEAEEKLLAECEEKIEEGISATVQTAVALKEIVNGELYRANYTTFEEYCERRWGRKRAWAYQQVKFAECRSAIESGLSTTVDNEYPLPESERQIRPIAGKEPNVQVEVWEAAVKKAGNGRIDGEVVRSAAVELNHLKPKQPPESKSDESSEQGPTEITEKICMLLKQLRDSGDDAELLAHIKEICQFWDRLELPVE